MMLCSACLLGVNCKYDGGNNRNEKVLQLLKTTQLIPVCPEQLGGLVTPRIPAEIIGSDKHGKWQIHTSEGKDVSQNFYKGAQEALYIAKLYSIKKAIFKQRSPSCGNGFIYDGSFSGKIKPGNGITTELLKDNGIEVFSEEDLLRGNSLTEAPR